MCKSEIFSGRGFLQSDTTNKNQINRVNVDSEARQQVVFVEVEQRADLKPIPTTREEATKVMEKENL